MECSCETCQRACRKKPGWFLPGEAEKAAVLKDMSLKEFFDKYLMVDFWLGKRADGHIFVLSPATKEGTPGEEFPFDPKGECIFYKAGKCEIHAVKPYECAWYDHTKEKDDTHKNVAEAWKDHQGQIKELLGREPEITEPDAFSAFDLLLG